MFLKQLRLENVRCFDELTLDFSKSEHENRKWTILVGENGTGKSTLLRAAALVTAGPDSLAEILGEPDYWIRTTAESCVIEAVIETADGDDRTIGLRINRGDTISDIIRQNDASLAPLTRALRHTKRNYFVAGYGASRRLSTERSVSRITSGFRDERSQSIATLFDNDAVMNPLESWAMDLDYQDSERGLKIVEDLLNHFLPGLTFSHIDKKRRQLVFNTPDGEVPLQYLSDGYQNVAAWTGDLLHRITHFFDDYQSPLDARGLLIVDEVDLHLHPKWQRSLHAYLDKRLPNMQLLVTTHSAITAQQANAEELHYLIRSDSRIEVKRVDIDPGKFDVIQLLMTEAFGLESREALNVEQMKNDYRRLRSLKDRSDSQEQQFRELREALLDYSAGRAEVQASQNADDPYPLLRQIQRELAARNDDQSKS